MKVYKNAKNSSIPQVLVICILSLSGLSFGMLFSWTSPSIPALMANKSMSITLEQASYFTIISQIAMMLASPLYGYFLHNAGRKKLIIAIGITHLMAWIATGFADKLVWFYVARFLGGLGDAGVYTVVPLYIAEIAEPHIRGTWGTALSVFMAIGKFLVTVIGGYTSTKCTAAVAAGIAILHVILTAFIPESPYYLLVKNREDAAKKALTQLRWGYDTDQEIAKLKADVDRQVSETGTYADLIKIESNRKALLISVGLRCALQYSGMFAFQAYAHYMFQQISADVSDKIAASVYAFTCLLLTLGNGLLSSKFGRRTLLIFSCVSCSIVLSAETIYFGVRQFTNISLDQWSWVPLFGMMLYLIAAISGVSFVPLLMQGELFSASIKHKANAIMSMVMAVNNIIVPKLLQSLSYGFGMFAPFAVFSCCTMVSSLFCCMYVIETKGKTLEEIQQLLKQPTTSTQNVKK